jgi:uncharacterized membrane protein YccF (DUF307 family)
LLRALMNILWAILGGGLVTALEYVLGGLILCLTIVGIPFGVQCFKLAGLALFPFGKDVVEDPSLAGAGLLGFLMNVLWFLVAGVWTFLTHVGLALGLAVTIIGIPFAVQHMKLAVLALFPFGRRVVVTP